MRLEDDIKSFVGQRVSYLTTDLGNRSLIIHNGTVEARNNDGSLKVRIEKSSYDGRNFGPFGSGPSREAVHVPPGATIVSEDPIPEDQI